MKAYSIPALIIATICLTIALSDTLAWVKRNRKNSDIAFILVCCGGAMFCLFCAGEYSVDTPIQSIFWLKGEVVASTFSGFALMWYIAEMTGLIKRKILILGLVWAILSMISQLVDLGDLTWVASRPLVLRVDLPFGLDFLYQEVGRGSVLVLIASLGFIIQLYLVGVLVQFRRSGKRQQSLILFLALGFVIIAQIVDFCIGIGLFSCIFLLEYAWLATILIVGFNRSNDFIEAAYTRKVLEKTDMELQISQATLAKVIDSTDDLIWSVDAETWRLLTFNQAFRDYFSSSQTRMVATGIKFPELLETEAERQEWTGIYLRGIEAGDYSIEYAFRGRNTGFLVGINQLRRDGKLFGLSVFARDITQRKMAEERMNQALLEKEVLLREIHHRTKNNMNVIISILRLQSNQMKDPRLKAAFAVSIDRIITMSLVHSRLYLSGDLSSINLKDYLQELGERLVANHAKPGRRPTLAFDLENVHVTIDLAMNCGMIVNELVTNALKYAFAEGPAGEIRIHALQKPDGSIDLGVSDTGVGLPEGFDPKRDGRLGFKLIHTLAQDSLHGQLTFSTGQGLVCNVRFLVPEDGKGPARA